MRAFEILQDALSKNNDSVHSQRLGAVFRAVEGLMRGGKLWLTALGRALPGDCRDKHRVKAVDRLLGNEAVHAELTLYYRALASWLLRHTKHPTILVDWTGVGPGHHALSAAVSFCGRALPILSHVYPEGKQYSKKAQRKFVKALAEVLPDGCIPVIVTDAGFHSAWFNAVLEQGWDFIGRIRNRTHAQIDGEWGPAKKLHKKATNRPKKLGKLWLYRAHPQQFNFVLSKARKSKGRKRYTTKGTEGRTGTDKASKSQAREPWLLATSLSCNAKTVTRIYASRMQIEESFRDLKNHRHGWALEDVRCKTAKRIEVLLMIAALANVAMQLIGLAAERQGLQWHYQVNTLRRRRVFSFFALARHVIDRAQVIPLKAYQRAITEMHQIIAAHSPLSQP